MTYALRFHKLAEREWNKLHPILQCRLAEKLDERLAAPRVPAASLRGLRDCYKIKLRDAGIRLVYLVEDRIVTVSVIAIGRRDDGEVYEAAATRLK